MKNRIRLSRITFGPEFAKPFGPKVSWPTVRNVDADLWLQGGLLFLKMRNDKNAEPHCFHPGGIDMVPVLDEDMRKICEDVELDRMAEEDAAKKRLAVAK